MNARDETRPPKTRRILGGYHGPARAIAAFAAAAATNRYDGGVADDPSTLLPALPPPARGRSALALTIVYHPDVHRIGEVARLEGAGVELARTTPSFAGRPLEDRHLSRAPLTIRLLDDGVSLAAHPAARAVVDGRAIGDEVVAPWQTCDRHALGRGVVIELAERVVVMLHLVDPDRGDHAEHGLVGGGDAIHQLRADITRVADLDVPVLLRGETGTGKELVARAIHAAGGRPDRPFVAINVAALPPTTAASELFGHARGAFTGAVADHDGAFARADGGTLFLDEIGDTATDVQTMLLRVIETSEVQPLGAGRSRRVAVRLIAATDSDLEPQLDGSGFRSALFHRLAGFQLLVPPLRERRDDIGRLLLHFLREELTRTGDLARLEGQRDAPQLWLPAALVARLAGHGWPGNVRQLRNAARQLAISSRGADQVRVDHALERLLASDHALPAPAAGVRARRAPSAIGDDELIAALRAHGWRTAAAALALGVSRSTLYKLIDRSRRIRKAKDVPEPELRRAYDACAGELDALAAELEVSRRALQLRLTDLGWDH